MARIMMLHKQFTEEQAAEGLVAPNQTVSPSGQASEVGESSLSFEIPVALKPLREKVLRFMEEWVYPLEALLHDEHNGLSPEARWQKIREAQAEAKKQDLWAIGHPVNLKGKGLPFMDYLVSGLRFTSSTLIDDKFRLSSSSSTKFKAAASSVSSAWVPTRSRTV